MFSYVFMKILEGRPRSYDKRINLVSAGRVRAIKARVAAEIPEGGHVLEIGCGTGELASMMINRGSTVEGFDLSPTMVEQARERIAAEGLEGKLTVTEMGADGMDRFPDRAFDAVVSTLVFSELTSDERRYALKHAARVLKPGGVLIIADEVEPRTRGARWAHDLVQLPMRALTYLVSEAPSSAIADLEGEVASAGFTIVKQQRSHGDAFLVITARVAAEGGGAS